MDRVLIVDDQEESRYYLAALLRGHGCEVISACHGAEALVKARQDPPQMVISDLLMQVMDGYTLLRHWKADELLRHIPFIVYTATYTDPKDEQLALGLGADAFIIKPAEPEAFMARIWGFLERGKKGPLVPAQAPKLSETESLDRHNEALVRKIEKRSLQLEEANRALERDLSDRKRAQDVLRESEERFRQVVETIEEVFWMTDVGKQQVLYVSPAYEKIWGRSCDSLYREPRGWIDSVHPEDRPRILYAMLEKQTKGEYDEEYRIIRPDGSVRWIHERAVPIRQDDGTVYRVAGVAEDVSHRRQLEEQLRQAQKMEALGQLAGGVAHDFNNLLAAIMMRSDLIATDKELPSETREGLHDIIAVAERAAVLTRQLLLFSRRQVMQSRQLNLNESVTGFAKMLQRIMGEDVSLQLHVKAKPLLVRADAGMLDQVLLNLSVNARDAMPKGGRLVIETSEQTLNEEDAGLELETLPGPYARLSISDTGEGIPPEVMPHIFEPFFTTKQPGKGTGLGLATVFGIVKQHRGALTVQSEVGRGTTVHVFLPIDATPADTPAKHLTKPKLPGGTESILLVEDESQVRLLTRLILERQGYTVIEACNGPQALQLWEQNHDSIRLLITDLVMPGGIDGRELCARLQAAQPALKVLFTSGYSAEIGGRDWRLAPGQQYLQKPANSEQLLETVRHTLDS